MSKEKWHNALNLPGPAGQKLRANLTYGAWDPFAALLLKMKVNEVRKFKKSYYLSQRKGHNIEDYLKWLAGRTFSLESSTENYYWIKRNENLLGTQWVPVRLGDIWFWVGKNWLNRFEVVYINYKTGKVTLRNTEAAYDKAMLCKYKMVIEGQDVFIWDQLTAVNNRKGWWQIGNIELEKKYAQTKTRVHADAHFIEWGKLNKRIEEFYENPRSNPEQIAIVAQVLKAFREPLEFLILRNANVQKRRQYYDRIAGTLAQLGKISVRNGKASDGEVGDNSGEVL